MDPRAGGFWEVIWARADSVYRALCGENDAPHTAIGPNPFEEKWHYGKTYEKGDGSSSAGIWHERQLPPDQPGCGHWRNLQARTGRASHDSV
jgi:hypothetical protein